MRRRTWAYVRAVAAVVVLCVVAVAVLRPAAAPEATHVADETGPRAPQALRGLEAEGSRILDGGRAAFRARLAQLRGYPVVVNQWASWCGPCRYEFPFFQRLARRYRGRVAFLGVDSQDARANAKRFLRDFPTPYPHYYDGDARIARVFRGGRSWPTTAFYDATGTLAFVHQGAYATENKLDEDIRKFALHG